MITKFICPIQVLRATHSIPSTPIKFIIDYNNNISNRYRMVGSVLWIIKPTTPRAQPEGDGLYNP